MPKVSVIVPIYGVENYIERCARSLFEQTLEDIELIFVNDCTRDKSIDILQMVMNDYPERKEQVTVLHHKENQGLPQARKTGILEAKGKYIIHCDSDDWVDHDMYRVMYEKALKESADVVVCDYLVTDGLGNERRVKACHSTEHGRFIENLLFQRDSWSLCNKLFERTAYYKGIIFPKGNMAEDMALCSQLTKRCHKIAYVEKPLYNYFINPRSISNRLTTETVLRNFYAICDNTGIVLKTYADIKNKHVQNGLLYVRYNAIAHLFPLVHRREYRKMFLETYPSLFRKILFCGEMPWRCKTKYIWALAGLYPRKIEEDTK